MWLTIIVFTSKTALHKRAYYRTSPGIDSDKTLFPDDEPISWIYSTINWVCFRKSGNLIEKSIFRMQNKREDKSIQTHKVEH